MLCRLCRSEGWIPLFRWAVVLSPSGDLLTSGPEGFTCPDCCGTGRIRGQQAEPEAEDESEDLEPLWVDHGGEG